MEVADAFKKIGFCGMWQASIFLVIQFFIKVQICWNMLTIVWIGYIPSHHCKVPTNSSVEEWIPLDASGKLSSCLIFVNSSNHTTTCVNGWTYDDADSGPTLVTKFDLVCDRAYLLQSTQMALTIGLSLGFIATKFSDKYGRKWVILITNALMSFINILMPFFPYIEIVFVAKLLQGAFLGGTVMTTLVYTSENFSKESREFYTIFASGLWGIWAALLPFIALLLSNWIYFQLFLGIYGIVFLPLTIWWLPETVPWLHANNRIEEAEKVLVRSFERNKLPFTKPILKPLEIEEDKHKNVRLSKKNSNKESIEEISLNNMNSLELANKSQDTTKAGYNHLIPQYSILELVKNRYLRRHMILAVLIFIDNMGYYGVTYMSGSLSVNRFMSGFFNSIVEFPACIFAYIVVKKFGRKYPVVIAHVVAAISIFLCILTVTLEEKDKSLSYLTLICNVVFKFFMSAAYAVIFIYGIELFPTNLRNQAIGICIGLGRFGSILASFSSFIIDLYPRALYACFGFMTLLGGLLTLFLPETSNRKLPVTLEDIEELYKKPEKKSHLQK